VTVIVPTRDRRRYLDEAIRSVLAQTFGDLELIAVDDGSTDGTRDLVSAVDDPRLLYLPCRSASDRRGRPCDAATRVGGTSPPARTPGRTRGARRRRAARARRRGRARGYCRSRRSVDCARSAREAPDRRWQVCLDLAGAIARHHRHVVHAVLEEAVDEPANDRTPPDLEQGLVRVLGERAHSPAIAGREHDRLHVSEPGDDPQPMVRAHGRRATIDRSSVT